MSGLSVYRRSDVCTLSDPALYHMLEYQTGEWRELPEDHEFVHIEWTPRQKRLSRIRNRFRSFLAKRRRHAYRSA